MLSLYLNLPYSFHTGENSAVLINNINIFTNSYFLYVQNLTDVIKDATAAAVLFAYLCYINFPVTASVAVVFAVVTLTLKAMIYPGIRRLTAVSNAAFDKMHVTAAHALQAIKEVKIYTVSNGVKDQYDENILLNTDSQVKIVRLAALPARIKEIVSIICVLLVAVIMTKNDSGLSSLSNLAVLSVGMIKLIPKISSINNGLTELEKNKAVADRNEGDFRRILKMAEESSAAAESIADRKTDGLLDNKYEIHCENVSFSYDNAHFLFSNDSLIIQKGETIGIKGPSGEGKSTL